jgi:hypothetical protein
MNSVSAIGGYFEIEHFKGEEYHSSLIKVNTGRNALEYILLARQFTKVYIPLYTCNVVLEPFHRQGIDYEFYNIDFNLEMESIPQLKGNEAILYTNYFGLKKKYIETLLKSIKNLIIDNAQAFFCKPFSRADTFYSPRKFFGLPDGGYVATTNILAIDFPKDYSAGRCTHLLIRLDEGPEAGFQAYKESDNSLSNQPIKEMSDLTYSLLCNIDYENVRKRRNANFKHLHNGLKHLNKLKWVDSSIIDGPMVYPFYDQKGALRQELMNEKVFTAIYWPNVIEENVETTLEYDLACKIISLPIDQRYNSKDMDRIISIINNYYEHKR